MPPFTPPSPSLLRSLRTINSLRPRCPSTQPSLTSHNHHGQTPASRLSSISQHRTFCSHPPSYSPAPRSLDRGPASTETTMTDFGMQDIFSNSPAPTASIDACLSDGFHLDNGVRISDGDGLILVQGEAFAWRPWEVSDRGAGGKDGRKRRSMVNLKGQWDTEQGSERTSDQGVGGGSSAWGLLETVWPKPEMLILGLGKRMRPLSPATRKKIHELGIRVDVQDTRNAAAQFNLLATERGVGNVACALVPLGRRD